MDHTSLLILAEAPALDFQIRLPLSIMTFLEFAIWGAWFVVLGQYLNALKFSGKQIGRIYATMALGSIFSPIFIGAVADRYFNSEYLMVILHLAGAGLLFWMANIKTARTFYWVTLAYALVYSPTLTLSNSISFSHIPDPVRDFPMIRVLGTIGWIAANLFLKVLLKPNEPVNNRPLILAGVLSVGLGAYSFLLPETLPSLKASAFPFLEALKLLNQPSFAVFFGVSFLITIALAFYFSFTSLYLEQGVKVRSDNVGPLMTIGQWVEIFFMFTLAWFVRELGMRWVLILGMAAWGIRYAIFAAGRPFVLILLGLALHGICFDFFFAAGMIYVEQTAPETIRASGQALFGALTYGLGMYLGTELSGWVNFWCTHEVTDPVTLKKTTRTNWARFWLVPCVGVLISLALFVALFR